MIYKRTRKFLQKILWIDGDKFMGIEIIYKLAGIGIVTAIVCMLLRRSGKEEMATLTGVAGLVLGLIILIDMVVQLFSALQSLFGY